MYPLKTAGPALDRAERVLIMLHGRGASAESILELGRELAAPGWAIIAPQAPGFTWYPYSFMAPFEANAPHFENALASLTELLAEVEKHHKSEHIYFSGFSQGACLALEFCLRNARRFGGIAAFSGGLIGPEGTKWDAYKASFEQTPIYMGCDDHDPHILASRFTETVKELKARGANVVNELLPGHGHTISMGQIAKAKAIWGV